jgi:hypothetical protein
LAFSHWIFPQLLRDTVQQVVANLRRGIEGNRNLLDFCIPQPGLPVDRFHKPYTIDQTKQLLGGVETLRAGHIPPNFLADLAEQSTRGGAGLYYVFERSKLSPAGQQALTHLERDWDAGPTPGPRFYTMLSDGLALAKLES